VKRCVHEPSSPVVAFYHMCKHCGVTIEPVLCKECDGTGALYGIDYKSERCRKCKGSGVRKWISCQSSANLQRKR
jgi:DnaJ-class molecular chaperone